MVFAVRFVSTWRRNRRPRHLLLCALGEQAGVAAAFGADPRDDANVQPAVPNASEG